MARRETVEERRYRREGDAGGPPEAWFDPKRGELGHLDAAGNWVAHECPVGFRWGADGVLERVEEAGNG